MPTERLADRTPPANAARAHISRSSLSSPRFFPPVRRETESESQLVVSGLIAPDTYVYPRARGCRNALKLCTFKNKIRNVCDKPDTLNVLLLGHGAI